MIDLRNNEILIVEGLQKELGCPVIRANQTAPIPPYPYVSYTLLTPFGANNGTWGVYDDGMDRIPVTQMWSFTEQSNDMTESMTLAIKARDWFQHVGRTYLEDNHLTVQRIEDITSRDNLLTIGYEYRNGFDVQLWLLDEVESTLECAGTIDEVVIDDTSMVPEESVEEVAERLEKRLDGVL